MSASVTRPAVGRVGVRAIALAALALLAACSGGDGDTVPRTTLAVESSEFREGGEIPERFSCEGENVPPPLSWRNVPTEAVELVVVVTDPDAPGGTFYHWLVAGLPPAATGLDGTDLPRQAVQAEGSSGLASYIGPCPPDGDDPHRYRFTVYALDRPSNLAAGTDASQAARQIADRAIAVGTLTGIFGR